MSGKKARQDGSQAEPFLWWRVIVLYWLSAVILPVHFVFTAFVFRFVSPLLQYMAYAALGLLGGGLALMGARESQRNSAGSWPRKLLLGLGILIALGTLLLTLYEFSMVSALSGWSSDAWS